MADIKKALLMRSTLYKDIDASMLAALAEAAQRQGLDARGLAASFDKFMTVNRQDSTEVTAEDVEAFNLSHRKPAPGAGKPLLAKDSMFGRGSWEDVNPDEAVAPAAAAHAPAGSQRITPYLNRSQQAAPAAAAHAPGTAERVRPAAPSAPATSAFRDRVGAGTVVAELNAHLPAAAPAPAGAPPVEVRALGRPMPARATYMVDRLEDRAAYVEGRIAALEERVEAAGGEVHPLGVASQQEAVFVGRVLCDAEEGRLNAQSVLLEGSARTSQGARVRLDVSRAGGAQVRLFPGQVVAVRGANPSGHCVVAAEVAAGAPAPPPGAAERGGAARAGGAAALVVAAGPFTAADNLAYEPLDALLEYVAAAAPDALVLAGPFVDAEHPLLRDGLHDATFQDVFDACVLARLDAFAGRPGCRTRVVLVPSPRDAHHAPVFPQPPLECGAGAGGGLVAPLAGPAAFACGGVVVGCSAADWLMAAAKEELALAPPAGAAPPERLPALAAHVLAQRSFFPMFPAPLGLPLDTAKAATALELPCSPDLLVLPSDLAPFAKAVALPAGGPASAPAVAAVCVNPGRLAKGATGGTFAHVHVAPAAEGGGDAVQLAHRCRVEVRRI